MLKLSPTPISRSFRLLASLGLGFVLNACCSGSSNCSSCHEVAEVEQPQSEGEPNTPAASNCDGQPSSGGAGGVGGGGSGGGGTGGTQNSPDWSFEIIETRSVMALEQSFSVELIRASRPDGGRSYLLYIPAKTANAPVMVMNQPYAGIDWTGEEVDERWANQGDGYQLDVDAPNFNGKDGIVYGAQSVDTAVAEVGLHLMNGYGVLHTYGRFYAGGDLDDDILDSAAPYHFLKEKGDSVDLKRIASYGGSWGGFMALYGAAHAPNEASPKAVVALFPPSDFKDFFNWTDVELPQAYPDPTAVSSFYSPYKRRILASTGEGASADFSQYTRSFLCANLRAEVLVPHDAWDTLVPVQQTEALKQACPEKIRELYWWRPSPIDFSQVGLSHGLLDQEPTLPSLYTFSFNFLNLALKQPGQTGYTAGHAPALAVFFETVKAARSAGRDTEHALAQVRLLLDDRTEALAATPPHAAASGKALVAEAVNEAWGTSFTADTIEAGLASGFPE